MVATRHMLPVKCNVSILWWDSAKHGEEVEKVVLDDQDAHHCTTDGLELAQGVDVVVVSLVLDGPLRLAVQFFDFVLSVRTNVRVESFEDMGFPL